VSRQATLELVLDCLDPETLMGFWQEALDYRLHYSEPSLAVLVPDDEVGGPPLLLQRVPEPKAGKNRLHVDIVTEDVEVEVNRLETLGARRLHDGIRRFGPVRWVTMADPEDNEFCVSTGVDG
jgi:predicted enzyme related to lactoylglutathione lyase